MKNKPAFRRYIRKHGRDVTVVRKTDSGDRDKYGDPINETVEEENTHAYFEQPKQERYFRMADGEEVEIERVIYLPDDVDIYAPDEDNVYSTEIQDSLSNDVYLVHSVNVQNNGVKECLCLSE